MGNITDNTTYQIQDLTIRMERNNKIIQRLYKKLNSYTCEPNNPSCFEQLYDLKQNFKAFAEQQNWIMGQLRQKRGGAKNLDQDIQMHLELFKTLEKEMADYLLNANQYA